MPITIQSVQWPFLIAVIIIAGTVLAALQKIVVAIRAFVGPFRQFIAEHDVLWEDYNIRTGGSYRRSTGRGNPPEPEEYRRAHPAAGE